MNNELMVIYLLSTVVWLGIVLILVLVGRSDRNAILNAVKEMNSSKPTLDAFEQAYMRAQEPVKLLVGVLASAVDFLGKSLPAGTFSGEVMRELDKLLEQGTDGKVNVVPPDESITVITVPPEPKPDIEPAG